MSLEIGSPSVDTTSVGVGSSRQGREFAVHALNITGVREFGTADRAASRIEDSVRGGLLNVAFGLVFDVRHDAQGGYFVALTATRATPSRLRQPIAAALQAITPDVPVAVVFDHKKSARR
jgi:hypothetical protein